MKFLKVISKPLTLEGEVHLPSSKSISNRLLIIRALSGSGIIFNGLSDSEDTILLQKLLQSDQEVWNAGNAGTVFRFLTAYLSTQKGVYTLTGSERMKARPVEPLVKALRTLGAEIEYLENIGYPPLKIYGKLLEGGMVEVDADISSQFISALMMIAPFLPRGLVIRHTANPASFDYVLMTQKVMEYFGLKVMMTGTDIVIEGGQKCNSRDITIEPDWSSAAFLYAIATMFEKVDLFFPGLCMTSWQGDVAIVDIMKQFGIATVNEATGLRILRKENIFPPQIKMNLRNHPDILPVIVSMCSVHQVPFIFEGVESLHYKESNRLAALADELKKTGIILEWDEERIYSKEYGLPVDKNARLNTYNDHRLAMSFLLLLLSFPDSELENPDSVGKSFPAFWDVLKSLGFSYSTFDH